MRGMWGLRTLPTPIPVTLSLLFSIYLSHHLSACVQRGRHISAVPKYRRRCPPPFVINNQAHLFIVPARDPWSVVPPAS